MKHGKKPTREQKILLEKYKLNSDNWLVVKNTPSELLIVHRISDKTKVLRK